MNDDQPDKKPRGPITDDEIQTALDWLMRTSKPSAQARADRVFLEKSGEAIKARLMGGDGPVAAQERDALASDEYKTHLEGLKAAVYADELYRIRRAAVEMKIEAWRTMCSNARTQGKIG